MTDSLLAGAGLLSPSLAGTALAMDFMEEEQKRQMTIKDANGLLDLYAEPEFTEKWKVNFATNTVAMGSAKDRWGFNFEVARKKGIKFTDVVDAYLNNKVEDLKTNAPIHEAILGMAVEVMPPPHIAQVYRIPKIWHGDPNSEYGQAMIKCDDKGPVLMSVVNIVVDPQAGVVATGRLFSGTVTDGEPVYMINSRAQGRVQQVAIYMGPQREIVGKLSAGNIPALLGLENVKAGETISSVKQVIPFEAVHYVTEPVVTIAVEPKFNRDLPRLVELLRKL